jgi:GT2 family glycosyltransferase
LGYEGAQDYDLILRASTLVDPNDIHHISKILYHWRMVEGSTALSSSAKSYATEAGLKALRDYIISNGLAASVAHSERDNFYTIKYSLPSVLPKVSIIIPTRDGMEVLRPCIESLLSVTDYNNYEVIILDNGSEEKETLRYLERLSKKDNFKIVRDIGEFNYSRINNIAVGHSTGELICLLNNDIKIIDKAWLTEMVSIAIREEVGCVGAKLLYPDGTLQHAGVILGLGGYAAHSHRGLSGNAPGYFCRAQVRQQLSAVTGACLLIKRDIYNEVGGLDESFQVAYNDVDFCLRVQALGYQNIYTPFARLIHHESKTRGEDNDPVKIKRFDREKVLLSTRWGDVIKNDPFYNVNLTRSREDFSI